MCTSITYKTNDNKVFLARTMDLNEYIPEDILIIPRSYLWRKEENRVTKYAILGMGIELPNKIGLYDGVNEKGLMCAALRFNDTEFNPRRPDKDNLSTCDFIMWVLSQFKSVEEVIDHLDDINLVCGNSTMDQCSLHWIISDGSSRTIVLEQTQKLNIYEDSYATMANDPCFGCQAHNCKNYNFISPFHKSLGLPGDFSSLSRFTRAAYCRKTIKDVSGEIAGLTNCFKILDTMQLQKGVDCSVESGTSYTQYTSCICSTTLTYYYSTYDNRQINAVHLLNEDLNAPQVKKYAANTTQSIKYHN